MEQLEIRFDTMKIAIDYDDTITLDKSGWAKIIGFLQSVLKADVRIVTFRCKGLPVKSNPDIDSFLKENGLSIPVIYTEGYQKAHVCSKMGWNPDVWIDDNPSTIVSYSDMKGMIKGCEASNDKGPNHHEINIGSPNPGTWDDYIRKHKNTILQPFRIGDVVTDPVYINPRQWTASLGEDIALLKSGGGAGVNHLGSGIGGNVSTNLFESELKKAKEAWGIK